jgi:ABC-type transporter lipoprotein component MlaA
MFKLENSPLRRIIDHAGAWDWQHDPWGTAMGLAFDVAAVLNASDIEGDVSPAPFARWQYRPSPYVTVPSLESLAAEDTLAESYGEQSLAQALLDGQITQADLIYAGEVLNRYTALLVANGKDY